jgi:mRNA-degrading endonuclease RelE of RelBE toxin-antitoxin system
VVPDGGWKASSSGRARQNSKFGPLLEAPYRVGQPLQDKLAGFHSARLGTQWRVLYRIDEAKHAVIVQDIQHRASAYRHGRGC